MLQNRSIALLAAAIALWFQVAGCQHDPAPVPPPTPAPIPAAALPEPASAPAPPSDLFTPRDPLFTAARALVNWWPGDGHALDLAGNRHGRLEGGATFTAGRVGQAFNFDGQSGYVDCGAALPATPAEAFTLMLWFRAEKQAGWQYLTFAWDSGGMDITLNHAMDTPNDLKPDNLSANIGQGIGDDLSYGTFWFAAHAAFGPAEQWHHVTYTFDGARIGLYRDGQLASSAPWTIYKPGNAHFYLASSVVNTGSQLFKGQMQDIALFSRALTPAEIAALYQAQTASPPPAARRISASDLVQFDDGLMGASAPLAWYAAQRLPAAGDAAVDHLAKSALAAPAPIPANIAALIGDLDSDTYAIRERATATLRAQGQSIEPFLQSALAGAPAPEAATRLQALLAELHAGAITPDQLRNARIRAILTRINTPLAHALAEQLPPLITLQRPPEPATPYQRE